MPIEPTDLDLETARAVLSPSIGTNRSGYEYINTMNVDGIAGRIAAAIAAERERTARECMEIARRGGVTGGIARAIEERFGLSEVGEKGLVSCDAETHIPD